MKFIEILNVHRFSQVDSFKESGFSRDSYQTAKSWKSKKSPARSHWASLGALQFSLGSTFPFSRWIADLTSSSQGSAATKTSHQRILVSTSGLQPILQGGTALKSLLANKRCHHCAIPWDNNGTKISKRDRGVSTAQSCRSGKWKTASGSSSDSPPLQKLSWGRSDPCMCIFFA